MSIDPLLCSFRGEAITNHPCDPYAGLSPSLSAITSLSDTNTFSSAFNTPLQPTEYTPPLYIQHPPATIALTEHTCLWNGCRSSYSSLAQLVSHVHSSHLGICFSGSSDTLATPSSCLRLSSELLGLSCQWDNCHEYASAPVAPSGDLALDNALNSLTGHLLHDHLGLQDAPESPNVIPTDTALVASTIMLNIREPEPVRDVEMRGQEQGSHSQTDKQGESSGGDVKQRDVAKGRRTDERSPLAEDKTPSPTSEKCCWGGCGLSFASVDDL